MSPSTRFRPGQPDCSIAPRRSCYSVEHQAGLAPFERAYDVRREKLVTITLTPSPRPATLRGTWCGWVSISGPARSMKTR
jgi:hypothetical protein